MTAPPKRSRLRRALRGGAVSLAALIAFYLFGAAPLTDAVTNRHSAATNPPVSEEARKLHAKLFVADLHADTLMWNRDPLERNGRGLVDVPRMIEGGMALQAFTLVSKVPYGINVHSNRDSTDALALLVIAQHWPMRTWGSLMERGLYQASRLTEAAAASNGKLSVIRTKADLASYSARRLQDPKITAGFLGVEGAQMVEGRLENVQRLFDAGIRMMAPTHFTDNDVGGSAHGDQKIGLTDFGRKLIPELERLGIVVDLAHASDKTIEDVLAISTRPVLFSHTGALGACANDRNVRDELLQRTAAKGGLIGVGFFELATCGDDLDSLVRTIRHMVKLVGVEHVALGSDFDGLVRMPVDASEMAGITDALLRGGFTESEIAAVMGGNVQRLLAQTLPD